MSYKSKIKEDQRVLTKILKSFIEKNGKIEFPEPVNLDETVTLAEIDYDGEYWNCVLVDEFGNDFDEQIIELDLMDLAIILDELIALGHTI